MQHITIICDLLLLPWQLLFLEDFMFKDVYMLYFSFCQLFSAGHYTVGFSWDVCGHRRYLAITVTSKLIDIGLIQ